MRHVDTSGQMHTMTYVPWNACDEKFEVVGSVGLVDMAGLAALAGLAGLASVSCLPHIVVQ